MNGENRPDKTEFDMTRIQSGGSSPTVDVISRWIWGGPGVIGAEEKLRQIDDYQKRADRTHRWLLYGIFAAASLSNPVVGHFLLKWLGLQ